MPPPIAFDAVAVFNVGFGVKAVGLVDKTLPPATVWQAKADCGCADVLLAVKVLLLRVAAFDSADI